MDLYHYSARGLPAELKSYEHKQSEESKPRGLWVSVKGEDDWPTWCRSEDFNLDRIRTEERITLTDDAKILVIDSVAGIDKFTVDYKIDMDIMRGIYGGPMTGFVYWIDWARVAQSYQGIVIAPYQWARRTSPGTSWYYGWDCASGCIWDTSAIAKVE